MASKSKKTSFADRVEGFLPFLVFLFLLLNVVLVFFFERDRKPKVIFHVTKEIVTNSNFSVSVPHDGGAVLSDHESPSSSSSVSPSVQNRYFDYFEAEGRPFVRIYNHIYGLQHQMSGGVIVEIYPDVIRLSSGVEIVNTKEYRANEKNAFPSSPSPSVAEGGVCLPSNGL